MRGGEGHWPGSTETGTGGGHICAGWWRASDAYQGLKEVMRRRMAGRWGVDSEAAARAIGVRPRVEGAPAEGGPLVERA